MAPRGRDAALARGALEQSGLAAALCADLDALCAALAGGAGALLIAEEALTASGVAQLVEALANEPSWSELPVVVLLAATDRRAARPQILRHLEPLRNVTLLDRPVRIAALVSTMRAALRARRRQYEIRDLMAQLRQALRTRDEFVAAVSHELRTPLNVILGWTATLQRRQPDPAQVAAAVQVIDRNGRVLWQLVEDLLDVARIASGRFQLRMERVDVAAIARASVETLLPTADAKRIELTCVTAGDIPDVAGDEVRLQQVIWNLLWNALKFTPPGGLVSLTVSPCDAGVEIAIADNGAGIDRDVLPHIFEPFRQGVPGGLDPHRGLGLGLAIVKHLIEMHGGSITATSEGAGRGARFRITLPAHAPESDARNEHRDATRLEATGT